MSETRQTNICGLLAAARRLVTGFEHVSGIARQWEPDYASAEDRAKWAKATEACADLAKHLAAAEIRLSSEKILQNKILRYYFGLNGGAGPVSAKGLHIVRAIENELGLGDGLGLDFPKTTQPTAPKS